MTDIITLSWSSLLAVASIVGGAMGLMMAYVWLVVDLKLTRFDRELRTWADARFRSIDEHVQGPELAERIEVVKGIKAFIEDMERRLPHRPL